MDKQSPVRIGIIGAGVIARHHAHAAKKLPRPVDLHITDPNPGAVRAFLEQFPDATVHADLPALLQGAAQDDEIIINATPPRFHKDATLTALRAGRHVLCEKPLALNVDEARQMLTAARDAGRLLGCCSMRFAAIPATQRIRQLLSDGALGDLYHVSFINRHQRARTGVEYQATSPWFLDPSYNGGGVVMDWGPYDIACLSEVLQPVRVEVRSAWMATPRTGRDPFDPMLTEQHVGAALVFHTHEGRAIPVTYERAACTHGEARTAVEVEGLAGAARWEWCNDKGIVIQSHDEQGEVNTDEQKLPNTTGISAHDRPLHYFHQRIIGEPSPALVNEQAIFNFSVLRAIYDAARTQQPQGVSLPSP